MKPESGLFDSIRVRRRGARKGEAAAPSSAAPQCQWEGCERPATHKAPMGRQAEGHYLHFCIEHVKEYNKGYNYFSGLDNDAIARFQKDSLTGHRPTWTLGVNPDASAPPPPEADPRAWTSARVRARISGRSRAGTVRPSQVRTLEKRAFDDLGLMPGASVEDVKRRYKELVKRHHPDANGGDRSSEDRLRQIIHAYKVLRQAGLA